MWLSGLRTQCCLCEDVGSKPGFTQWVKASGVGAAVALIPSLAQELPYAAGIALEKEKKIEQQLDFYKN